MNNQQTLPFNIDNNQQAVQFFKPEKRKRTRLLVKRGMTNIVLLLEDIAAIYTRDKLVYVIDRDYKKFLIDKTLMELEEQLDQHTFFRVNRQFIININFVKSFKPFERVKLLVDINIPGFEEDVIVSQQVAPTFKKWMNDA
jgi:DNA-binding LytR/AlgR family response regulator